jgi:tetratricopeptide (TPR) repeat protein
MGGIFQSVSNWLHRGYRCSGAVQIGETTVQILACTEYNGSDTPLTLGPWRGSASGLDEAIEWLAQRVTFDLHRSRNLQLELLGIDHFPSFLRALAGYQAYTQIALQRGPGNALPSLEQPASELAALAKAGPGSGLVYSYLGSIYLQQGKLEDARKTLQQASELDPEDRFASTALRNLEVLLASRPQPLAESWANDPNLLRNQDALQPMNISAAINQSGERAALTIAILADESSCHLPSLQQRYVPGRRIDWYGRDRGPDDPAPVGGQGANAAALIAAIAPESKILPVRVVDESGVGSPASICAGIRHACTNQDVRIMLLLAQVAGNGPTTEYQQAMDAARRRDLLLIAPAVEDGAPEHFHSSLKGLLRGLPTAQLIKTLGAEDQVQAVRGVVSACAILAGIAALVRSANPTLRVAQVAEAVRKAQITPVPSPNLDGKDGIGLVDALVALQHASAIRGISPT